MRRIVWAIWCALSAEDGWVWPWAGVALAWLALFGAVWWVTV